MTNFINKITNTLWENPILDNSIIHLNELDNINRKYFKIDNDKQTNKNKNFFTNFYGWFSNKKYISPNPISESKNIDLQDSNLNPNSNIKIPILDDTQLTNTTENHKLDPLGFFIAIVLGFFIYIYFAGEFFCQILGLFYPIYKLYFLVNNQTLNIFTINAIMNYFVIFGHIEVLSLVFKIFGLYFYHLKMLVICIMVYLKEYRQDWLGIIFFKIIFYDKIIYGLIKSGIKIITKEYNEIRTSITITEDDKKMNN